MSFYISVHLFSELINCSTYSVISLFPILLMQHTLCSQKFVDTWSSHSKPWSWFLFVVITSTLLGRVSTRFWSMAHWFAHSTTSALVRSDIIDGQEGLLRSQHPNWFNRYKGLRSGHCTGHSSSFTPALANHIFRGLALCTGALSCWNRIRLSLLVSGKDNLLLQHTETLETTVCFQLCGKSLKKVCDDQVSTYFWPYSAFHCPHFIYRMSCARQKKQAQ